MVDSEEVESLKACLDRAIKIPSDYFDACLRLVQSHHSTSAKTHYDFFLIGCAKDEINETEFLERIKGMIVPYSLKAHEYASHKATDIAGIADLAKGRFTSQENSGELGELILFGLLECQRNAPQIASKMSLKTDPNLHFQGFDAIHLGTNGDEINLYYGESKMWRDHKSAVKDAISGLSDYETHPEMEKFELNLVCANIDVEKFAGHENELRNFLIPYGTADKSRLRKIYVVFIGSNWQSLTGIDIDKITDNLQEALDKDIKSNYTEFVSLCDEYVKSFGFRKPFEFFVIPFEDIASTRNDFRRMLGLAKEEFV